MPNNMSGKCGKKPTYNICILVALPQSTIYMSSAACSSLRCVNKKEEKHHIVYLNLFW